MPRHHILSMGLLCLFLSVASVGALAQSDSYIQVTNLKAMGFGYTSLQDTYLSPEHYHGIELRYLSHTIRQRIDTASNPQHPSPNTHHPIRRIINEGTLSSTKNRTGNGTTLAGYYHFEYGVLWHCFSLLGGKLRVNAGAQGEFLAGFIYNTRNGNNPAQARGFINIGGAVHADYLIRQQSGHRGNMTLSYDASLPLLGLTFSPNYGQSYYEIFSRGNYDHNIVPTTIASMPSLRHQLTFTYYLRSYGFTIGYLGDYRQQSVNKLKQHVYSHSILLGLTKKF